MSTNIDKLQTAYNQFIEAGIDLPEMRDLLAAIREFLSQNAAN